MIDPTIAEQCARMADKDLVLALTQHRDHYEPVFFKAAEQELLNRGIRLDDLQNRLVIPVVGSPPIEISLENALMAMDEEMPLWDVRIFINSLNETLVFQKEAFWISIQYAAIDGQTRSFHIEHAEKMKDVLRLFVQMNPKLAETGSEIFINEWPIISESDSIEYLRVLSSKLGEAQIPTTLKKTDGPRCNCGPAFKLLVAQEYEKDAKKILKSLDQRVAELYAIAESFSEETSVEEELAVYNELADLIQTDPIVLFNRGVILFEKQQYEQAALDFIRSAHMDPGNLENIESCVSYLRQIVDEHIPNNDLLLNLAVLMTQTGYPNDQIIPVYEAILQSDDRNAIAHASLGHLFYEEGSDDKAGEHFKAYLDILPSAEDREQIEMILETLSAE